MGVFTKDIKTLDDLFVHTLGDIYYAEQQIAKNLPDMVEKATDQSLKNGFGRDQGTDCPPRKSISDAWRRSQGR